MALGACRECGKQVSTEAKSCPQCGVESPVQTIYQKVAGAILSAIMLCAFLVIAGSILSAKLNPQKEEQAEQECLKQHPLNEKQVAARKHFTTCWQYRHTPSSVWSDSQRSRMLYGESCFSDERDDPRYDDAARDFCKSASSK